MMKHLETQKFLREKKAQGLSNLEALQALNDEFSIKVKVYDDHEDRMVLLDYHQIDSPKTHPITIECRSLILCLDTFNLISKKFDRFFNLNECPEFYKGFRFQDSFVLEKADGSLIGIYRHKGVWHVSTRGMAKAEGEHPLGGSFRNKVLDAFGFKSENDFQNFFNEKMNPEHTFIFEFISPENRIVTKYEKPEMVLLGINEKGKEKGFHELEALSEFLSSHGLNVRLPKRYSPTEDLDQLVEMVNALDDLEEGFVVWDPHSGKRVKVKSKAYLVAHKLRGDNTVPSRKNILDLILEGEIEEFLAYFPEMSGLVEEIKKEILEFESYLTESWEEVKDILDQKEFALKVKDLPYSFIFFEARKKHVHPVRAFHEMDLIKKKKIFQ